MSKTIDAAARPNDGEIVNAKKWRNASNAVAQMSEAYRAAAASSGELIASQLRARPQVEKNTELLQKNKVALKEIVGWNGKVKSSMREVYRDQLRVQRMTVTSRGLDQHGNELSDITVPTKVNHEWDTLNQRIRFTRTAIRSASEQMINFGKNTQWTGRQLTVGLTYPMVLFAGATAKMAYDVDKELTRVQKVYDSTLGPDATSVDRLRESNQLRAKSFQLASDMATKYGASATEVLKVEAALAATGLNGSKLMSSTDETIRIATLGEVDFSQATDMTIALQQAFKSTIKTSADLTRTFDMMNAVENATSLSIQDMAEAVPRAATALAGLKVTVDETAVLMTAMRSAGIDAAEGANALKSISARIINPGVLKGAQSFFDGFVDLADLSKESGGNIYKFATRLGVLTKNMDNYKKQQGMAKLFGAWQYNRGSAIVKGLTDAVQGLGGASDQTARAMKTVKMSAEELAAISAAEIEKKMNSISGRFSSAFESIKNTAAEIGQSMLPYITNAIQFLDKFLKVAMKVVGGLGETEKKILGIAAVAIGLAGPVVMAFGLIANLLGQGLKLLSIGQKFNLVNRAQQAAEVQARRSAAAYDTETTSVVALTTQLRALAAAQGYSTGVAEAALAGGVKGKGVDSAEPNVPGGYIMSKQVDKNGKESRIFYKKGKNGAKPTRIAGDKVPGVAEWKKNQADIARSVDKSVKGIDKAAALSDDAADAAGKTARSWNATSFATATMVGSMTVGALGAEELGGHLMTASMGLMGLGMAVDTFDNIKNSMKAARIANEAVDGSGKKAASTWKLIGNKIAAGAKRLFGLARGFGVLGWGLTAAAVAAVFIWKKTQESSKRQDSMNKSTDSWAKALGGVAEKYQQINIMQGRNRQEAIKAAELAKKFKKDEGMKDIVDTFTAIRKDGDGGGVPGDDSEMEMRGLEEYIKMVDKTNLSAKDAKIGLEAMFLAAGWSADVASEKADKFYRTIGEKVDRSEFADMWRAQANELLHAGGDLDNRIDGMVKTFSDKIAMLPNAIRRQEYVADLQAGFVDSFGTAMETALTSGNKAALDAAGLETTEDIKRAYEMWLDKGLTNADPVDIATAFDLDVKKDAVAIEELRRAMWALEQNGMVDKTLASEREIVEKIAQGAGLKGKIVTMEQLILKLREKSYAMTVNEAKIALAAALARKEAEKNDTTVSNPMSNAWGGELEETTGVLSKRKQLNEAEKLSVLNHQRALMMLEPATKFSQQFQVNIKRSAEDMNKVADNAARAARAIQSAKNKIYNDFAGNVNNVATDAMKSVWTNITSAVGDEAKESMSAAHSAQMSSLEAGFARESNALDARGKKWDDHYDKAIRGAEAYYDRRVKAVERVIKAEEAANDMRQRIFEAERTRLQRMAELQNSGTDWNVAMREGNFDEAAKIASNRQAKTAGWQMDDEEKRADIALEARKASLEKQIELLEKQRERRTQALEDGRKAKQEAIDNAKSRMDAENDIERRGLEKRQGMQSRYYDMALAELNSFIPTSAQELEDHIADINKRYGKYGVKLQATSGTWAQMIARKHNDEMRLAANRLKNDVNWAGAGYDAAKGMMSGMAKSLGMNGAEFKAWLGATGNDAGRPGGNGGKNKGKAGSGVPQVRSNRNEDFSRDGSRHEGGPIGRGGRSARTGFSGSQSPHSERTINAKVGEYMINDKSVKKYGMDFFDKVNDGKYVEPSPFMGGPSGPGFLMGAFMGRALATGAKNSLGKQVAAQQALMSSSASGYGVAAAGKYGDTGFSTEQLKNAATIAGVGKKMGMSQRDIIIALMTAMQESMLKNLKYGDRDSQGLFQQRPSMGWGTVAQVTTPTYAARKFFEGLKGIEGRKGMSLTAAAQAVQRSAYPDAYAKWEDEARAIVAAMAKGGGVGGFVQGKGGTHRATRGGSPGGIHYNNGVDVAVPVGTPIFAVKDGTVSGSYDIPGWESRRSHGGNGYRSYGRVVTVNHGNFSTLYAHLSKRSVTKGQQVRGGAIMGRTGNTGNSSGPHLHFEAHGASPYAFLRKGGELRWDNTPAVLHKGETVLTAPLTKQFKENVAKGGGDRYDITVDLRGAVIRDEFDFKKAVYSALDERERRVGKKRTVGR